MSLNEVVENEILETDELNELNEAKRPRSRKFEIDSVGRYRIIFTRSGEHVTGSLSEIHAETQRFLLWYGTKQYLADNGKTLHGMESLIKEFKTGSITLDKQRKSSQGLEAKLLMVAESSGIDKNALLAL